jgi:hypothetical protein
MYLFFTMKSTKIDGIQSIDLKVKPSDIKIFCILTGGLCFL